MLTLDRYQELMRLPIAAFNGLNDPNEPQRYQCATIWTRTQREDLQRFIQLAENTRYNFLGYYPTKRYIAGEEHAFKSNLYVTERKLIHAWGVRTVVDVALDESITVARPNVTLTLASSAFSSIDEVYVFKPGTDIQVKPYSVTLGSGTVTIVIPLARLALDDNLGDSEEGLDYYDDDNFVESVDVKRVYYDETQAVTLLYTASSSFVTTSQTGYIETVDTRLGIIRVYPATWLVGSATPAEYLTSVYPYRVRLNYLCGGESSDIDLYTCRLAHTLMPFAPTSCEPVVQYWQEDMTVDDNAVLTPYGRTKGAVDTWMHDSMTRIGQGGRLAASCVKSGSITQP
jgi:hypothetical protein